MSTSDQRTHHCLIQAIGRPGHRTTPSILGRSDHPCRCCARLVRSQNVARLRRYGMGKRTYHRRRLTIEPATSATATEHKYLQIDRPSRPPRAVCLLHHRRFVSWRIRTEWAIIQRGIRIWTICVGMFAACNWCETVRLCPQNRKCLRCCGTSSKIGTVSCPGTKSSK